MEGVAATKTAFNVMVKQVQDYVAEIPRRRNRKFLLVFTKQKKLCEAGGRGGTPPLII
jgi:hypothetical protein